MSVRRTTLAWVWWAGIVLILATTLTVTTLNGFSSVDERTFVPMAATMVLGYATVGALISSRIPGNPTGPLMMGAATGFVAGGFTAEYSQYAIVTVKGSVLFGTAAAWLSNLVWFPVVALLMTLLAVFPTGTVPSPGWRWLPRAFVAVTAVGLAVVILNPAPILLDDGTELANPTGVAGLQPIADVAILLILAALGSLSALSFAAVVVRFRRARGVERQQLRLLTYVAAVSGAVLAFTIVTGLLGADAVSNVAFYFLFAGIGIGVPVALGVAILRYRLYDIDVVIKKTVVFAILVGLLALIGGFVGLLVGLGVVPSLYDTPPLLLVAGVAYGLLTMPLWRLARRIADRVIYGGRATPYEVLTEFSDRVGETYSAEDVLPRMAQILASGNGAEQATVWLRVGTELRPAATWPEGADAPRSPPRGAVDVLHRGESLGALSVVMPASDPMNPSKERLIRDLASQAGLVLRNVRLIAELRESRRRIVAAQDERAKRLERDIHDGAQQQLVALAVKLGLASSLVGRDQDRERELLRELQAEAQEALENLRDLVRGIYPPLLADQGLAPAISAQARKAPIPVHVEADSVYRYPPEVEAGIYFSILEALQNTAKYAKASGATVRLWAADGSLSFEVSDDGVGFDPDATSYGTGLQGMADRLEALGGELTITSRPGYGTTVMGRLRAAAGGAG
jgi:signal transduction histidine kinase